LADPLPGNGVALAKHRQPGRLTAVFCLSDGIMYWGDAGLDKIEAAYINGTARRFIGEQTNVHYFAFLFHDGYIYFTDWTSQ